MIGDIVTFYVFSNALYAVPKRELLSYCSSYVKNAKRAIIRWYRPDALSLYSCVCEERLIRLAQEHLALVKERIGLTEGSVLLSSIEGQILSRTSTISLSILPRVSGWSRRVIAIDAPNCPHSYPWTRLANTSSMTGMGKQGHTYQR